MLVLLLLSLASSELALAVAPPPAPPAATPACPQTQYPDAAALLTALPAADYACAEELAAALRPWGDPAFVDALLALAATGPDERARRNGLRALGRMAEAPPASRAREAVLRGRGAASQNLLRDLLRLERDNFLLQDAVWLLDSSFYPSLGAASALEGVAADPGLQPALRARAAAARARLIFARPGPLAPSDQAFMLDGLRSSEPGVRTAAAHAIRFLHPAQRDPANDQHFRAALAAAWRNESPLRLAPDPPDPRGTLLQGVPESSPTSLTARAAIARAQDRLNGTGTRLAELQTAYEALALPHTWQSDGLRIRTGLPEARLPALAREITRTWATLDALVGPELAVPLAEEGGHALTILIFAGQGIYRDYMRAFTPFTVDVDGIYDQAALVLYTHERSPMQSANTLSETLRHEATHHYTAGHLFPGSWLSPGYHREPKGWADEGLAEVLAGLGPTGPQPRPAQLARLCARRALPPLRQLIEQRTGYDQFGQFDYAAAWAFSAYLLDERPEALRQIYAAYRTGSYRVTAWETLAGLPLAQAEAEWGAAVGRWCAVNAVWP